MPTSIALWITAAVLLFWTVGAYNRLMRLRADANTAFGVLDAELSRQVDLVRNQLPPPDSTQPAALDGEAPLWVSLHAAAAQFAASLAATRGRPLEPERIAALGAAQNVLEMAWERAERDDAHDLAGPFLPESVTTSRAHLALQTHAATDQFNLAVSRYNEAITQFPAILLAWVFGFKAGRPISRRAVPALS